MNPEMNCGGVGLFRGGRLADAVGVPETLTFGEVLVRAIIAGAGILLFAILMLVAIAGWMKAAAARRWPTAPGRVIESRVEDVRRSDGGHVVYARIAYEYSAGRRAYRSNVVTFGQQQLKSGTDAARRKAEAIVAHYALGSTIVVRHHPRDPADAVLEPSAPNANFAVFGATIFLFAGFFTAALVLLVNAAD
jgi:hypothetical protein